MKKEQEFTEHMLDKLLSGYDNKTIQFRRYKNQILPNHLLKFSKGKTRLLSDGLWICGYKSPTVDELRFAIHHVLVLVFSVCPDGFVVVKYFCNIYG